MADVHVEHGREVLAARLRHATLRVVCRQWQALGADTATWGIERGRPLQALIDPEALLLVSLVLMSDEYRLAELLHEWGKNNSALLSVQRTAKLATAYHGRIRRHLLNQLTGFATVARVKGNDVRWRSVIARSQHRDGQTRSLDGHNRDVLGAQLKHLETSGRVARSLTSSEKVVPGDSLRRSPLTRVTPVDDAALMLRLRQAFGVGVKADVLTYLLGRVDEPVTAREICEAAACTPAAARRAAEELAAARLVKSLHGQSGGYQVTCDSWKALLEFEHRPPRWGDWSHRFVFATAILDWADTTTRWPAKPSEIGARERNLVQRYRSVFEHEPAMCSNAPTRPEDCEALLRRAAHDLTDWMDKMA